MVTRVHPTRVSMTDMFAPRNRSTLISVLIHATVIVLLVVLTRVTPVPPVIKDYISLETHDISKWVPRQSHNPGGGGGGRDVTPASAGQLPKVRPFVFTAPKAVLANNNPLLAMEPALLGTVQITPVLPDMPFGVPGAAPGPPSNGRGSGDGIGDGKGGGAGDKEGPGYGDGDEPGVSGGGSHILGTVVQPILLVKIDPEYSDEARQAKIQGIVIIRLEVDTHGTTRNIKVVQGLGMGLDERARDAVSQWKFKPATIDGKPAVATAIVNVTFRLL